MQYITEQEIDKIASDTCKALQSEPKVTITIRPENNEAFWEGGINGHFFRIKTDTPVQVPLSLAGLIAQSNVVRRESEAAVQAFRRGSGKRVS